MIRPRQVVHRGSVEIGALLIEPGDEGRKRVLALWGPGVDVSETPGGWFVRFPARRLRADAAWGLPLVLGGEIWSAAPLTAAEIEALCAPPGAIVRVKAGSAVVDAPPFRPLDPSTWLDLESWSVAQVTSLGAPPPVVQLPEVTDVRAVLDIARLDSRAAAVAAALTAVGSGQGPAGKPGMAIRALATVLGAAMFLAERLRSLVKPTETTDSEGRKTAAEGKPSKPAAEPASPGLWRRLEDWLASWMTRTGLMALLERQHAAYLQKMLDLFDSGDLLEALRYAIPLGGSGGASGGPAWLPPAPRDQLRISSGGGSARSLGLGGDLYERLRGIYERAWKRLVATGHIEEAAFVLAELLKREEEAVQLLETHGLLRKSAEVAEARGLAPGLIVRQWWLAGEHERALGVARRSGAFADALIRLEKAHAVQAVALRIAWAVTLADAGDHAQAVEVIWPVEQGRARALVWMDEAIAGGGTLGAAMCVRKLSVAPDAFPDVRDRVLAVLSDGDPSALAARRALYDALLAVPTNPAVTALARPVARAALRDLPDLDADKAWMNRIIDVTADPVLRSDVTALPQRVARAIPLAERDAPTTIAFTDDEAGALPAVDVVPLADGRLLVALGEAGVRLVARDGRTLRHWDQPATQLVANPQGNRVITVIARGEWARLGRIDLTSGAAAHWADADFDHGAPAYDGSIWYVAHKDAILGIDATAEKWRSLWRVGDLGGQPTSLSWGPKHLGFIVGAERWSYELPGPRLRSREGAPLGHTVIAGHGVATLGRVSSDEILVLHSTHGAGTRYDIVDHQGTHIGRPQLALSPDERWIVVSFELGPAALNRGSRLVLFRVGVQGPKAHLHFDSGVPAAIRFGDDSLVVATTRGHLVTLDLRTGAALRRLRLT